MALDGLVLHQIQTLLQDDIPAKINKIQQISDTELLFTIRSTNGNQKLLISAHSVYNRIHISEESYTSLEVPSNFLMLLRKQIDGGIIRSLQQIGLDRILQMKIEVRDDLGDMHYKYFYIELMGKYANMILVDEDGKIIDALKRIPPFENNTRTILPSAMFQLPKQHDHKQNPYEVSTLPEDDQLTSYFHGFSPLLSKEVIYRLQNQESFQDIMKEIKTSKQLYISDIKDTMHFHCIPLTHLDVPYRCYELMKGMDILYFHKEEKIRIKQQSGDLFKIVRKELHKNTSKLPKLKNTLEEAMDCDKYREYADLLFAYMYTTPKAKIVKLPSFETNEEVSIPIDMKYDLKQNANKYYQKYHKAKRAQIILQEQIQKCEKEIAYFESMEVQLEQASLQDALEIREELIAQGYMKASKAKIRKKSKKYQCPHYETFIFEDATIYIGKNNLQNEYVTWKLAQKQDTWLHTKYYHGAHVVLTCENPSEERLRDAAMLAAYYSKGRYSSSVPVDYCLQKHLKKIPGSKTGLVSLSTYKTIYIDPDIAHIQQLIDHHLVVKKGNH